LDSLIPITALIIAGGENLRMGRPKPFVEVGGRTVIERQLDILGGIFKDIIVVSNDPEPFKALGLDAIPDDERFRHLRGPMTGIYTGLKAARNPYAFAVACDMPFLSPQLIRLLAGMREGYDAVVPRMGGAGGMAEPLFAVYSVRLAGLMENNLACGQRRLQGIFEGIAVRFVDETKLRGKDPELLSLMNLNTPEELARADALARA
jgi:molybdopterin-guanine dinucleotide biosynthesis protein A